MLTEGKIKYLNREELIIYNGEIKEFVDLYEEYERRKIMKEFDRLVELIKVLRGKDGCPWDRVQTLESLKPCLIEETAEVLEAMEGDPEEHKGELGDLLMNIVFQADIREDEGKFNIEDVSKEVCEKLIRRHPHVFGDKENNLTPEQTLVNWEAIKRQRRYIKIVNQH